MIKERLLIYTPALCIVVACLVTMITGVHSIAYSVLFVWGVYRADLVPVTLVLAMGLIVDSVNSLFLGLEALLYLYLMWTVQSSHRFLLHYAFNYLWGNLSVILGVVLVGKWLLALKFNLPFSCMMQLFDTAIGVLLFPSIVKFSLNLNKKIATS